MGRLFLGLALLHRYKNSHNSTKTNSIFNLLSQEDIKSAEILGKAMRFGAMFSLGDLSQAGRLDLSIKKKTLTLTLFTYGEHLFGEVAKARFISLAASLECQDEVVFAAQP